MRLVRTTRALTSWSKIVSERLMVVGFRIGFREDELRKEMDEMKVLGKRKTPARLSMSNLKSNKRMKRRKDYDEDCYFETLNN